VAATIVSLSGVIVVALVVGSVVPAVGAPAVALVLGACARSFLTLDASARRVAQFASKRLLQAAVVLLGGTFGLGRVLRIGAGSAPVMLGTLAVALLAAVVLARVLRIGTNLATLVGVGTAICGASAIGAVSGVIAASEAEIAYAVGTIFIFNIAAVLTFPLIGHALSLSQHAFGLWAGTAVNDTSSVVAASLTYGQAAGAVAVVTKLARTTMIVPIVLVLAARRARNRTATAGVSIRQALPLFVVWFIVASALNAAGAVPTGAIPTLSRAASTLIVIALAAIGLSTSPREIRRTGLRPVLFGALLWAAVAASGLALQQAV
jgi:uncharacterized integral membrane protein (TIGR00698 family)